MGLFLMSSLIKEVRREAITVRWIMLTILGAAVNAVLWSQYLFFYSRVFSDLLFLTLFSIASVTIIMLFSMVASTSLPEKRIVAPSDIHLASFAFIVVIWFAILHDFTAVYVFTMILSFLLLYILGITEDAIIARVIGIYGSQKNCGFKSYSVALCLDETAEKLKDKDFARATGISKSSNVKGTEIMTFHTPFYVGYQIFLFLKENRNNKEYPSLLNVISYERMKYGIVNNKSCELQTLMITHLLRGILEISESPKDDNDFRNKSFRYALRPTESKLEFERISIRTVIASLIILLLTLPVGLYWMGYLAELRDLILIEIPLVGSLLIAAFRGRKT